MKYLIFSFSFIAGLSSAVQAQQPYPASQPITNLVKAEYFFDRDPGIGNGNTLLFPVSTNINNFAADISLAGLSKGIHNFYLRVFNAAGNWSLSHYVLFNNFNIPSYTAAPNAPNVVTAEYYIDSDPGAGNGTPIVISPGLEGSNSVLINVNGLSQGVHRLFIRTKDANGKWSLTNFAVFENSQLVGYPTAPAPAPLMSAAEYFIDTDPGFGNATAISLPSSNNVSGLSFDVPVGSLPDGRHTLYIRSRQNPWSIVAYSDFVIGSPLPVVWRYVKAEKRSGDAEITWATSEELNADFYSVEYSYDGRTFESIGTVAAHNSAASYSMLHASPAGGVAYYRIRQVDKDGKFTFSKVMTLLFRDGIKAPIVFPNPASNYVHVVVPGNQIAVSIEITDAGGRVLKRIDPGTARNGVILVDISGFSRGNYFIAFTRNGKRSVTAFIKQ